MFDPLILLACGGLFLYFALDIFRTTNWESEPAGLTKEA
jgi:hypothetical protein